MSQTERALKRASDELLRALARKAANATLFARNKLALAEANYRSAWVALRVSEGTYRGSRTIR